MNRVINPSSGCKTVSIDEAFRVDQAAYDASRQILLPPGVTDPIPPVYPTFGCIGPNSAEASQVAFNNSTICVLEPETCKQQPDNTLPYPYDLGCGTYYNKTLSRYVLDLMIRVTAYFNGAPLAIPPGLVQGPDLINITDRVQGVLFSTPNKSRIYVCFRGTSGLVEWDLNAKASQVKWPLAGVPDLACHDGFVDNWKTMTPNLNEYLATVPLTSEIVVTGHSSGGALASLTAYSIAASLRPTWCYAFSAPKVCNLNLDGCLPYLKAFFRIYNRSDIIPTLPTSATPNCEDPDVPFLYNATGIDCTFNNNRLSLIQSHVLAPIVMAADADQIMCFGPEQRDNSLVISMVVLLVVFIILIALGVSMRSR